MTARRTPRVLLAAVVLVPVLTAAAVLLVPAAGESTGGLLHAGSRYSASQLPFSKRVVGPEPDPAAPPWICNVKVVDLQDGRGPGVLVCDARLNRVSIFHRAAAGAEFDESVIAEGSAAPVPGHATPVDIDGDGDVDVAIAVLGNVFPDDAKVGAVTIMERRDDGWHPHRILDEVRRVTDVQPGDFDADGDVDLAVAVFGFYHGRILWLRNDGPGAEGFPRFTPHDLHHAAGPIHAPVADFDGDGDLDIASGVTQDDEEVWGFENLGGGRFAKRLLWQTFNFDIGGAGLVADDLDQDGDVDLLLPVGDNFEQDYSFPQPYHGCLWLENRGEFRFVPRRIADLGGTYAAAAGDVDGDGDRDVVCVSMFNEWRQPGTASIVWLENDGAMHFTPWQVDDRPTHLVTVGLGDLDGDGDDDIVAGGLHVIAPYDRLGGVTLWMSGGAR
ncbi:MAG: VCBS repeat-containing protein [Planctomycetes bacterium]|nr:VCBS repeat-containing protein [Planctomycetota bacterium]